LLPFSSSMVSVFCGTGTERKRYETSASYYLGDVGPSI
jgi:hypothetical protein